MKVIISTTAMQLCPNKGEKEREEKKERKQEELGCI